MRRGAHVVALLPGYFLENFLAQADTIRTQCIITYPYAEGHAIAFISVADIAAVAPQHHGAHKPDFARVRSHHCAGLGRAHALPPPPCTRA